MAGETPLTIIGNLTADPEMRFTGSGVAVTSFTIASTPRTYNRQSGQWEDATTLFMRCSAWRDMAENITESLTKGTRVVCTGRLVQRDYQTNQGEQRHSIEMQVDEIGPSLRYATADVKRTARNGQGYGSNQGYGNQGQGQGQGQQAPRGNQGQNQYAGNNGGGYNSGPQQGQQGSQQNYGGGNQSAGDAWQTAGSAYDDDSPTPF